jgi:hypothetical protein
VELKVRNAGQTPAYHFRGAGLIKFGKKFDDAWLGVERGFAQNSYVLPGSDFEYEIIEPIESVVGEAGDDPSAYTIFVFGRLEYIDAFGVSRWTNFRFSVAGDILSGGGAIRPCESGNDAN